MNINDIEFPERKSWGFNKLEVGQVMVITKHAVDDVEAARQIAHTYARKTGKKFTTRKIDGDMFIKRLK